MRKIINIFKAGPQTTMSGHTIEFSEMDLHKSASVYSPNLHVAPLVLGHPATDAPAYGQVVGLKTNGSMMYADVEASDQLVGLVRNGSYLSVSAAFYPPDDKNNPFKGTYYLRHVGFLGATPPAVKGLGPLNFADSQKGALCFADGSMLPPSFVGQKPMAALAVPDINADREGFHRYVQSLQKDDPSLTYVHAMGKAMRLLEQQKKDAEFARTADPARMQQHMNIRAVMEKDPSLTYAEATDFVLTF